MNYAMILFIGLVGITILMKIVQMIYIRRKSIQLVDYVVNNQFDDFDQQASNKIVLFIFPRFNLDYLMLSSYLMRNDEVRIDEQFAKMFQKRLTTNQQEDLCLKAINYYVSIENKEKSQQVLDYIRNNRNEKIMNEAQCIYKIFMENDFSYIDEMEQQIELQDDYAKASIEYLLAKQYENKGDEIKASYFFEQSNIHMTGSN
ncbi:hypothetical protein A4S06_09865 [Erysipelotrichaceae bacterium MTC7]|nr:hypothetical protein A4S06_09865 [Erysipelotrichaceae bacterium MTC7]